jgi:tetratricopeptide (TPR) repeat protein
MQLKLKHSEHATHAMGGAFIRGNAPAIWLREIHNWNIAPAELVCFIISQNNQPGEAAGLFVIFSNHLPNLLQVQHPYAVIAGKLFIPLDAELSPQVSEPELRSLLIWDYQVFHPAFGFIGFERSDRIQLIDLLQLAEPSSESWHYAHPGQSPWMHLQQISVQPVNAEAIFESVKEAINSKSIEDIPGVESKKSSALSKLLNPLGQASLKGGLFITKGLISALTAGRSNFINESDQPGLLNRLTEWMADKLQDLEKQRDTELKRLSDMFETNTDEALQYAIPLSSKYFSRGSGPSSGKLTKRPSIFNLNKLGGGEAIDGWNVDNYYNELRNKYLKAAERAIANKDYKKAAYVYAHLLGDYQQAANALKQGKHYREAAVLYKEHLDNVPEAAACLEEGGLLLEAIDLYTSIDRHEKSGDLYMVLDQEEQAQQSYELSIQLAAGTKDYLEVSRIIAGKLGDTERAKKTLIKGWHDVKQPEACLEKYFNMVAGEKERPLHQEVKYFFENRGLSYKKMSFLNVLDKINQQHPSAELENTCRNIAYELVTGEVEKGNANSLHMLKNFVPADRLLPADCYRFIHTGNVPAPSKPVTDYQLVADITWKQVLIWRNELLVLGVKSDALYVARINWDGHVEYYPWIVKSQLLGSFLWVANDRLSNRIILHAPNALLMDKTLPENNYFRNELIIECLVWLPKELNALALKEDGITTLHTEKENSFINHYSFDGQLKKSYRLEFGNDHGEKGNAVCLPGPPPVKMTWDNGYFYSFYGGVMLRISEKGVVFVLASQIEGIVFLKAVEFQQTYLQFVMLTNKGCFMIYPEPNAWNVQTVFFAEDILITGLKFINENRLAVISNQKLYIYETRKDHTPYLVHEIETKGNIVTVFPAATRNQVGILEEGGKISVHDVQGMITY